MHVYLCIMNLRGNWEQGGVGGKSGGDVNDINILYSHMEFLKIV